MKISMKIPHWIIFYITLLTPLNTYVFKGSVNAIAFWRFLDDPQIKTTIENKCGITFSHNNYYTNSELLNIFKPYILLTCYIYYQH